MMNKQLVFNDVVTALLKQGVRSVGSEGYCVYRNKAGHKCAVGHLIRDEAYDPELETCVVSDRELLEVLDEKYEVSPYYGDNVDDTNFLRQLQDIHDSGAVTEDWPDRFLDLAKEHDLDMPGVLMEALK